MEFHPQYCALFACAAAGPCSVLDYGRYRYSNCSSQDCIEQPTPLISTVCVFSAVAALGLVIILHCLSIGGRCAATVGGLSVAVAVTGLGLMPLVASPNPQGCGDLLFTDIDDKRRSSIFLVNVLATSGSIVGLAITFVTLSLGGWRYLHTLAKVAAVYFASTTLCNVVGVVGALLHNCTVHWAPGRYFVILWLSGSIATTLLLQRLLVERANVIDPSRSDAQLRKIYYIEVAVLLLAVLA